MPDFHHSLHNSHVGGLRLNGKHLEFGATRLLDRKHTLVDARLAGKLERYLRDDPVTLQQACHDLDTVGIPEPPGLCGTASGHRHPYTNRQIITHTETRVFARREELDGKTVNLQNDAITEYIFAGHEQHCLRGALHRLW